MGSDYDNIAYFLLGILGALFVSSLVSLGAEVIRCHAGWADFGKVTWGPIAMCRVELPDGRKVPTSALQYEVPAAPEPAASK